MNYWGSERVFFSEGVRFVGVGRPVSLYTSSGRRSILEAIYFSIMLFPRLLFADFDVVDCSQFPYLHIFVARLVCWIRRRPLVVTWHEVWLEYWGEYLGMLGFFGELFEWLASRCADRIIVVSAKTRRDLVTLGVSEDRLVVVPNGVTVSEVDAVGASSEGFDVVFAGRLLRHKNVDVLIDAVSSLDGVSLLVLGEGPDRMRLEGIVSEFGILDRVSFRDFVGASELYGLIKSAGVVVLPSSREGFGLIVLEANACGTPVVTVKHAGNAASDLIDEGVNGFVANLSVGSIAARINEVLGRKRGFYRNGCVSKAAKFEWDVIFEKAERVYGEVADGA